MPPLHWPALPITGAMYRSRPGRCCGRRTPWFGGITLLGWRLLADTLANIQIRLLGDEKPVGAMAEEATQQLFTALRESLPPAQYQAILSHSGRAVVAWQQARRPAS